ncbi:DUF1178 family protein [Pararhodobacter sp. SW119]|uniref:DUF1178 family protein n=1 Tax=Pararhodobacter sp. SW119 TaxID=2780075 RepID=UPI001ADF24D2|nr:DUF1178 family protein [Pararhodobacter sp. SW119]
MIRYALRCDQGHDFESWFASAAAYDGLKAQGHVACAVCGSGSVEKALMAPAVSPAATPPTPRAAAKPPALPAPPDAALAAKIAALRKHIEASSDYVGLNFAAQARAMHLGDAPERPIHGEAKIDEARALIDEGVPVAPLPFLPRNRTN